MIVYTANFGGKDVFKELEVEPTNDVRYVYFTDQEFESDKWEIIKKGAAQGDSTKIARWYKMHSHVLFPGETTVWMDANLIVTKDPSTLGGCDQLLVQTHQFRVDAYEESNYCIRKRKGDRKDIERQILSYLKLGYGRGHGLYTTRVLVRKPTDEVAVFNSLWWDHLQAYSMRDQISFPFVLHASEIPFSTIGFQELKLYFYRKGGHRFRGTVERT